MPSEHARAVALAEAATDDLDRLFTAVGGVEAPQAPLWRAYRVARAALGERWTAAELSDVTRELTARVQGLATDLLAEAAALGQQQAADQLAVYRLRAPRIATADLLAIAQEAVIGGVAQQHRSLVLGFVATGDAALILGGADRVGALSPAPTATLLARWLTTTHQAAFAATVEATRGNARFRRQAVATISKRTTQCCLNVHGQIVDLDKPFQLSGTPRYADELMHAPFHHRCRTVEALVPASGGDDALTTTMRAAARAELRARAQGGTTDRGRSGTALAP
jgi:hypothetical protein